MAERVRGGMFGQTRFPGRFLDSPPHSRGVDVVAPESPRAGVEGGFGRREEVLPAPLTFRPGVFAIQAAGQLNRTVAGSDSLLKCQSD